MILSFNVKLSQQTIPWSGPSENIPITVPGLEPNTKYTITTYANFSNKFGEPVSVDVTTGKQKFFKLLPLKMYMLISKANFNIVCHI